MATAPCHTAGRGKAHLEGSKQALGVCLVARAVVRVHCLHSLPPDDQIIRHYFSMSPRYQRKPFIRYSRPYNHNCFVFTLLTQSLYVVPRKETQHTNQSHSPGLEIPLEVLLVPIQKCAQVRVCKVDDVDPACHDGGNQRQNLSQTI